MKNFKRCIPKKVFKKNLKHLIYIIEKMMVKEKRRNNYIKKIKNYFSEFLYFMKNKNISINLNAPQKASNSLNTKFISNTNKIKLDDVYFFVNERYKNYKLETKNNILSKMRKYTRIIHKDIKINYTNKISDKKNNKNFCFLTDSEILKYISNLKENDKTEIILIFYFLYFSGLNFTSISRIRITHFNKNFSLLKVKKGYQKEVTIPPMIQTIIIALYTETKFESEFFFYDKIKGDKILTRVEYIKKKMENSFDMFSNISDKRKKELIQKFSKIRKHKILTNKYPFLFDLNFNYLDDSEISKFLDLNENRNSESVDED